MPYQSTKRCLFYRADVTSIGKNTLPHREVVWVFYRLILINCLLLLLWLWASGQRACVVRAKRHVHSDAAG